MTRDHWILLAVLACALLLAAADLARLGTEPAVTRAPVALGDEPQHATIGPPLR